jgi:hypothetical protein
MTMMTLHESNWWRLITRSTNLSGLRDRLDWRENVRRIRTEADIERLAYRAMIVWCCAVCIVVTAAAA